MKPARIVLGLALLVLVFAGIPIVHAWIVQRGVREVARAERVEAEAARERALATPPDAPRQEPAPVPAPADSPEVQRAIVEGWWSEALQAMGREGLARGWAKVRGDALPDEVATEGLTLFRGRVETLPDQIGRELALKYGRQELIATGIEQAGVFATLEGIGEELAGPMPELLVDGNRYGALFTCDLPGPVIQDEEFLQTGGPSEGLADGTTLRFGPGVKNVYVWVRRGNTPRCLTIEGAGMDRTLILSKGFQQGSKYLDRLTLRDCTIYGPYLLSLRGQASQVLVERVRMVGFDEGESSGICLTLERTALLMRDCRFEAGYGKNAKGIATLFDVRRDSVLARFEGCRFDGLRLGLQYLDPRATVVFDGCTMTDLRDAQDPLTLDRPGIRLVDCSVSMGNPDGVPVQGRDLEQLFPGWQQAR